MTKISKVLVIAGSDPSGGAGMQADLRVIALHDVYGAGVITCLTAQNTQKVYEIFDIPIEFLRKQIVVVLDDINFDVIKIGMLANLEVIECIANELDKRNCQIPIILDPVMVATSGDILLKENAIYSLKNRLASKAFLITPNINEAEILSEIKITDLFSMQESARKIKALGAKAVLIKGGHLNFEDHKIHNILLDENDKIHIISNPRIEVENIHGTGCSLASAISANLAKKYDLLSACQSANNFIFYGAKNFQKIGKGSCVLGLSSK